MNRSLQNAEGVGGGGEQGSKTPQGSMWERIAAQVTKKSKLQCSTFIINTRNPYKIASQHLERYKGKEIILALRFVLGVPYVQLLLLIKSKRHSEDQIINTA